MVARFSRPASSSITPKREPNQRFDACSAPSESAEDLIRKLIQKAAADSPESPEAILEVEVDGRQYTLICSPKLSCPLSPREQEIVRLVAQGLPNKCISAVLEISTWTVATHLRRIFAKVGVSSRAAMIARLLERGKIMRAHVADSPTFAKVSATASSSNSNSRVARKYPARAQGLFGHVPVEKSS